MQFVEKTLTPDAVEDLFQCPIQSVHPFTLMLAPVYVFMKRNQKFVSVKAPLDFFTPDELEKLKVYEVFYLPKFVKSVVRFQTAARLVKSLFALVKEDRELDPAPFEMSNETLKLVGRCWGKQLQIEPFFMAIFSHELCGELDGPTMVAAREQTVVRHDWGILLSGAFVFIAVQIGYHDFAQLVQIRNTIYEKTVAGHIWEHPANIDEQIVVDLNRILRTKKEFSHADLEVISSEWARKLAARFVRIKKTFARTAEKSPTIYGEEGFAA